MSAKSRVTRHRQWAANAIEAAMRLTASPVDQEVLMRIACDHLVRAENREREAANGGLPLSGTEWPLEDRQPTNRPRKTKFLQRYPFGKSCLGL